MTVATSDNRIENYGDAVTTAFAFPYYFFANGDLKVYLDGVLQTITTHYTVAGAGVPAGGTVTFVTAPPNLDLVVIYREVAITQSVDYTPNDPFPADTHEQALDRLTMIAQQIDEEVGRALKLPSTSTYGGLTLPDPQSGYFLQWKADLSGLQNVVQVPAATYTVSAFMQTVLDDADPAAVLVTLGSTPGTVTASDAVVVDANKDIAGFRNLILTGQLDTGQSVLINPNINGITYVEMGYVGGVTNATLMDFHTGATAVDYDSRIAATSGTGSNGGGTLNITAATIGLNGTIPAATITTLTATTANVNNLNFGNENLSVYDEGTWTPSIVDDSNSTTEGQTYTTRSGSYIQIGNMMFFGGVINLLSSGTLNTAQRVGITGLPVLSPNFGHATITSGADLAITSGVSVVGFFEGTDVFRLNKWSATTGTSNFTIAELNNGTIWFSGSCLLI
jgi:hypothetical protein